VSAVSFVIVKIIIVDDFSRGYRTIKKVIHLTRREGPFPLGFLGYAYGVAGRREGSQGILDEVLERSKRGYFSPFFIAIIYAGLGDEDNAFEWLEKTYEERDPPKKDMGRS
jgi:hypothetical protein